MGRRSLTEIKIQDRISRLKTERNILLVSPFTATKNIHDFQCLVEDCGNTWSAKYSRVWGGSGCSECATNRQRLTAHDLEFADNAFLTRKIKRLSAFTKVKDKHEFLCLREHCGRNWFARYDSVSGGRGCPTCRNRIKDENLELRLAALEDRNIILLSKYTRVSDIHTFLCLVDNKTWDTTFTSVYSGKRGCPHCSGRVTTAEQKVITFARNIIRVRLTKLFLKGKTSYKIYHDNHIYQELIPHWINEYKSFLCLFPKPDTDDEWQLDHIIPVSWFDPYDLTQLKLCWNSRNLQWLTASENYSKHNNIRPQDLALFTD